MTDSCCVLLWWAQDMSGPILWHASVPLQNLHQLDSCSNASILVQYHSIGNMSLLSLYRSYCLGLHVYTVINAFNKRQTSQLLLLTFVKNAVWLIVFINMHL